KKKWQRKRQARNQLQVRTAVNIPSRPQSHGIRNWLTPVSKSHPRRRTTRKKRESHARRNRSLIRERMASQLAKKMTEKLLITLMNPRIRKPTSPRPGTETRMQL